MLQVSSHNSAVSTQSSLRLIPELNQSVPTGRGHLGRLVRVPQGTDADRVVCLELVVQLLRLPVPDEQLAVRITRYQIAATTSETNTKMSTWYQYTGYDTVSYIIRSHLAI